MSRFDSHQSHCGAARRRRASHCRRDAGAARMGNYCSTVGPGSAWGFHRTPTEVTRAPCSQGRSSVRASMPTTTGTASSTAVTRRTTDAWASTRAGATRPSPGHSTPPRLTTSRVHLHRVADGDADLRRAVSLDGQLQPRQRARLRQTALHHAQRAAGFGQPGSTTAMIVDWKGRDKSKGSTSTITAATTGCCRGTPQIRAVADGVVNGPRLEVTVTGSDNQYQKEVAIRHTVMGARRGGDNERFLLTTPTSIATRSWPVERSEAGRRDRILRQYRMFHRAAPPLWRHSAHEYGRPARGNSALPRRSRSQRRGDKDIEPYGWSAPKGFDPWA